ncbi:MAG: nucleoside deaminase, partial [Campylobacteraceae bacterium]|nr:nucleoside deaminase [Campylobacteraceae bacterium]
MNQIMNEVSEVNSAEQAASLVLSKAMQAVEQGTFAVGGCIVENSTGRVIHAMHNNVLKPLKDASKIFTYDPTAHGERQLVYWYYQNKDMLNLPEAKDLTIVTTLDPCAMCTGTLLTAGFNVAVVAIDDFAGINYNETFSFETLPPNLRPLAKSKFGYYACGIEGHDPSMYVRSYVGGENVVFKNSIVSSQSLMGCGAIFTATADAVRDNSS